MRRIPLASLLIGTNLALMLLVSAGLSWVAVSLLEDFADTQGRERVVQSAHIAQQAIARSQQDVADSAQLLSERPTLMRLLNEENIPELTLFLSRFSSTSHLGGVAVFRDGVVVAASTPPPLAVFPANSRIVALEDAPPILAASVAISETFVVVAAWQPMDAAFARQLGQTLGLDVRISGPKRPPDAPDAALHWSVIQSHAIQSQRIDAFGQYVAIAPLGAPPVATVEVLLPTAGIRASLQKLIQNVLIFGAGVAFAAALLNLLIGQRLGKPLRSLARAAARIGNGDLTTPVAPASGAEIGRLAGTLEEMRRRLGQLTTDLRHQQAEANAILTGIVEGVFSVDRERRIRYLNPQAAGLLGIEPSEAIGRFCGDVLRPQLHNGVRPCVERCPIIHARFSDHARAVEHLQRSDGTLRTVVITSAGFHEHAAQVQVIRDETEQETTRRLRDTILATISHEFRTPLSAQLASLELLLDQLPTLTLPQIAQLLVSLQRGSLRLTHLIDNLLESARIEAGQLSIRRQEVLLDVAVDEALELMQPLISQREQAVELDLPYPLPSVLGDTTRLTQVFVNLLANASKFSPQGSTLRIGGRVDGDTTVTIWLDDEGPGIPEQARGSLFSRFVRSHATEPEQSGAGLGLWIVESIVERHQGRVAAQVLPHGTRLIVTLPVYVKGSL